MSGTTYTEPNGDSANGTYAYGYVSGPGGFYGRFGWGRAAAYYGYIICGDTLSLNNPPPEWTNGGTYSLYIQNYLTNQTEKRYTGTAAAGALPTSWTSVNPTYNPPPSVVSGTC